MSSHVRSASANEIHAEPHCDWISEEDWNNYIKEDPRVRPRLSSVVSIFRVPKFLKDTKIEAYVPQRVSLGPYHHRSAELRPMDHHKGRALRIMMESFKRFNTNMDFADRAREEILKLEKEIRDSYEENIDCDGETLARMLTLDGCFILEVLKSLGVVAGQYYEPIFGEEKLQYAAFDILNDILMLENQVPLIVLRTLLELEINSAVDVQNQLPVEHILCVFNPFEFHAERFDIKQWYIEKEIHHLLGFLHTAIVSTPFKRVDQGDTAIVSPPLNRGERVDQGECSIFIKCCCMCTGMFPVKNKSRDDVESPRAVELRKAGIKFERCDGGIKEIKFDQDSATISLPPIIIQDSTEIVFRNLMAFEMCKPLETNPVTCYVRLMDELIDSQEDVALLRRMGLLTNHLGSDQEVAGLFKSLCKDAIFSSKDAFNALRIEVNLHYKNKLKVQFAELVRDHFSSPWNDYAGAAVQVSILLLLFTVVQTIFSIISVYKGK